MPSRSLMVIRVRGTVQGVGFRPAVWRFACDEGLAGDVRNDADGVLIRALGDDSALARFVARIRAEPPPLARIEELVVVSHLPASSETSGDGRLAYDSPDQPPIDATTFAIVESAAGGNHTRIAPDAAVCSECLRELSDPDDRRFRYPFANCTHCGPRFSIVTEIPYDRSRTTMSRFALCDACRREYENPGDRRFHAQPIACSVCGPRIWLEPRADMSRHSDDVVLAVVEMLLRGRIVAWRGLGSFHLACDAMNQEAVARLRERKRRFRKPFALMARDVHMIRRYCRVSPEEAALLASAEAPIVLLDRLPRRTARDVHGDDPLPDSLAPGIDALGFMLPYTPLHSLVLRVLDRPLVMTSGNVSDEPPATRLDDARTRLADIADLFLMHDRDIANRIDDSVVAVVAGSPRVLRRARGYAPAAIRLPPGFERAPAILAYGGELKATFCLVKDGAAVVSQHQGDLEDAATLADYEHNLGLYARMYDHDPQVLAVDLHPEYLATKIGRRRFERAEHSGESPQWIEVQHHHAHLAACMAENQVPLDSPPLLGISLDGLGLGDDGTFWGGEFLLADYRGFRRLAAFQSIAMPGGAQAMREPWRNTYAHLATHMGWEAFASRFATLDLRRYLEGQPISVLERMLRSKVNSPLASSCGRLFDAVAAALGVCPDRQWYEGQCAAELETLAARAFERTNERTSGVVLGYPWNVVRDSTDVRTSRPLLRLDAAPLWQALCEDLLAGVSTDVMAARFHVGLASVLCHVVRVLERGDAGAQAGADSGSESRFASVVLSGGCWQNRLLLNLVVRELESDGRRCLLHAQVPPHDGGLSLGQAAIAAARALASR